MRRPSPVVLRPRIRVLCGRSTALGPGRVDLLELIESTGSVRAAAARMKMSYMRAWSLVKSLNSWFRAPLVEVARGGRSGGGAKLTKAGHKVIALYRHMEQKSQQAAAAPWKELRPLLKA